MTTEDFIKACNLLAKKYVKETYLYDIFSINTVWYSKTLQNHKSIMMSPNFKDHIFEFSYNGDKDEIYMDVYDKECNRKIRVEMEITNGE